MKLADLLDEHGLKLFPGAQMLFGILWGFFGSLLVLGPSDIANVTLAMVLAFIVRMRIDYRNHAIAAVMIVIAFVWKAAFEPGLFAIFFIVFTVFGGLRDYLGDVRKKKDWLYKINEPMWYYFVPPAVYGTVSGNWGVFFVFTIYGVAYDLVKYGLFYARAYQKL